MATRRSFLLLFGLALPLSAQTPAPPSAPPRAGSVMRWWEGAAVFGGVAVATLFDEGVQHSLQEARSRSSDDVASVVRRLGQPEVFVTIPAVFFLTGMLSRRPPLRHAATRIAASLAVTGVLVTATKFTVGRQRPSQGEEPDILKPFSGSDAFPSGHASMAFALATSIADEIRRPWATVVLMTAATGTAWSRLNDNAHWLSDVLAGAALGITSAQVIERRWRFRRFRVVPLRSGIAFRLAL